MSARWIYNSFGLGFVAGWLVAIWMWLSLGGLRG